MKSHPHFPLVEQVYHSLKRRGYTVFLAGGCVRDFLLGRPAQDFDLASSATPDQVKEIFPNALMVGSQFGTAVVPVSGVNVEVTTFRSDGLYKDGRHPEKVVFSTPEEDAQRRDFTINAMFYDLDTDEVVDFVEGRKDLLAKQIRAVGEAKLRFEEDSLRILRALRFSAQLGFEIEEKTAAAILELAPSVSKVSRERIQVELRKMIEGKYFESTFPIFQKLQLFSVLFPEAKFELNLWQKWRNEGSNFSLFFAVAFLSGSEISALERIYENLRLSRDEEHSIKSVLQWLSSKQKIEKMTDGEILELLFNPAFNLAFKLSETTQYASVMKQFEIYQGQKPQAFLSGQDLLPLVHGERLGEVLKKTYQAQLTKAVTNKNEAFLFAKKLIG